MLVDGEIMTIGAYPDMEDLTEITGLSFQDIRTREMSMWQLQLRKGINDRKFSTTKQGRIF